MLTWAWSLGRPRPRAGAGAAGKRRKHNLQLNGSPKCLPGLGPWVAPDPEQVLRRQESAESITFRSMGHLNAYLGFVPGSPPDPEQVLRQQESRKHNQQMKGSPKSLPGLGTRVAPYPEQMLGRQESAESITYI